MTSLTEQQQAAVFSVDKNVLVSAGAGSGKTHVLVERYVEILRNDPVLTVDGIIAVTFTRKAAGEMRTRLKSRFRQLTEEEPESDKWRQCLADIDSARIGTIHSLCETILKAFPAECGIDPQVEVIDEVTQAQLLEESIDQTFREIIGDTLPEIKLLTEHNIEEIRNWVKQMLAASLQFEEASGILLDLSDEDLLARLNDTRHRIQRRLLQDVISKQDWKQAYSYLAETFARDKLEQLRLSIVQAAEEIIRQSSQTTTTPDDSAELWRGLEIIAAAELRVGGHSDEAKAIKERIGVLRSIARKVLGKPALPPSITSDDLVRFEDERHCASLFYRAQRNYEERKKLELKLDYNDLIGLAYKALAGEDSPARQHYQDRVRAILVDEFQDTNTIQAQFISFLAGPKTRLFLIGDDKQSIYKFQGADVSNFNEWKSLMALPSDAPGRRVNGESMVTKLTVSFRSHPNVVAFVNGIFSNLLAKTTDVPYRADFEPLSTFRKVSLDNRTIGSAAAKEDVGVAFAGNVTSAGFSGASAGGGVASLTASTASALNVSEATIVEPKQLSLFEMLSGSGSSETFASTPTQPASTGTSSSTSAEGPVEPGSPVHVSSKSELLSNQLMPDDDTAEDFSPPDSVANVQMVVFDAADDEGERDSELSSLTESRAVAKWIQDLVKNQAPLIDNDGRFQRALKYGDFAVLVPKNSNFPVIERALAEREIPYVTFAGRGFLNRQEVIDIENLLYFLGNPQDSHALFGTLRSPMFALSDDTLHELYLSARAETPDITLWDALRKAVSARRAGYEMVLRAVSELRRFMDDAARLNLTSLIRKIIQRTSYDLALMSSDNGKQRARNLWKLVAIAKDHEELSFFEFANRLTLMRDFELKQTDAPFESHDAVKLMTIHASKGLEFPAVALPCLSGRLLGQERKLIFHRNYGFALDTSRGESEQRPVWYRYARQLDQDMEVAERKRLLYVGMTRARDYLAMFLEKDIGQQAESFRLWLADILDIDFHGPEDELGMRKLNFPGGQAEYSLSVVDRKDVEPEQLESLSDESAEEIQVQYSLIEPILPNPIEPNSRWKGWTRVTPSKDAVDKPLDATVVGVFLHTVLEHMPPSLVRPDESTLTSLALMQGSAVAHPERLKLLIAEGNKLLDIFYESELFSLMKAARRRLTEFPYVLLGDIGLESRRPDLIIEDENGDWFIIDYKTDAVTEEEIISQARRHAGQLETYRRDIKQLTGLNPSTRLYFARPGRLVDPMR
ncbi:UvrD-helicase domain-containing protein [Candidatus Obscuribacterales bacterium]|nr:UvrD-helicase domain-containing protein [Candidatus Obscuribacterales bacterium]